ncbi:hypothetical protein HDU89_000057 [Geranomyces variabilis]|nr:hypothetical protein HDU89_000057 [Geranomyces variabilis]
MSNTDFRFFPETPTRPARPPGCAPGLGGGGGVDSSRKPSLLKQPTHHGFPSFALGATDYRCGPAGAASAASTRISSSGSHFLRSLSGAKDDDEDDNDLSHARSSSRAPGGMLGAALSDDDNNNDNRHDDNHRRPTIFAAGIESPLPARKFGFPSSTPAEEDEDVYGFGDFGQVFVTEEDLDRARQKLSEEEAITPEQSVAKMLDTLRLWSVVAKDEEDEVHPKQDDAMTFADAALCFNFVELGRGALLVDFRDRVVWHGELLALGGDHSASEVPSTTPLKREPRTLRWQPSQLTDVRVKDVGADEKPVIALTVSEEHFVQFAFAEGQQSVANACAEAIRGVQKRSSVPAVPTLPVLSIEDRAEAAVAPPVPTPHTPAPRKLWRAAVGIIPTLSFPHPPQPSSTTTTATRPQSTPAPDTIDDPELLSLHEDFERRRAAAKLKRDQAVRKAQEDYQAAINELDGDYTRRRANVLAERKAAAEAIAVAPPRECQLCFDELETQELKPCGHRLCGGCATKLQSSSKRCPWDRAEYTDVVELQT